VAEQRIALFIDAENVPASLATVIIDEAKQHGALFHRRVYGDFSRPALAAWLEVAPRFALTNCQTVSGAAGKNGADIALVIEAMDLLHSGAVDMFCLATGDSDFTQLAMRLRQGGKLVVGVGMPQASALFRAACDVFKAVDISNVRVKTAEVSPAKPENASGTRMIRRALKADLLQQAFVAALPKDGEWVGLQDLLNALKACQPGFKVKSYGHSQLNRLLAFSGVELSDNNRKARLRTPMLKKVVDNG
jgi:uncharacterized LabA/DUF88 family protein